MRHKRKSNWREMKVTGRKKSENENEWWIQLENRMKKSFKPQRNQKKEVKVNETFSNHSESNEPNGSQWIPMEPQWNLVERLHIKSL